MRVHMSTQSAFGCSRFMRSCLRLAYRGDDTVADKSLLLNVNIVDEPIYGCNDIYLTWICFYFSDVVV